MPPPGYTENIFSERFTIVREFLIILLTPILVALAILAVWSNHFDAVFQNDDGPVIVNNRAIQDLSNVPLFFTKPLLAADRPEYVEYQPLTMVTYALDYWVGGAPNVKAWNIDSFVWFLLEVLLFFAFSRLIPGSGMTIALLTAALLVIHPLAGEVLNYASRRGEILGAVGLLASLIVWIVWQRHLPKQLMYWNRVPKNDWDDFQRRWTPRVNAAYRWFINAPLGVYLIPLIFGLLADPAVAVFPLLALTYILLFDRDPEKPALWRRLLPSALLCSVYFVAQLAATWKYSEGYRLPNVAFWITEPWVVLRYFSWFFVPVHLTTETDLQVFPHFWAPAALAGFAGLGALITLAWQLGKRGEWKPVSFGLWWFLITLIPCVAVPRRTPESDTFLFIPMLGLVIASVRVGWMLYQYLLERAPKKQLFSAVAASLTGIALLGFAALNHRHTEVWTSETSYWDGVVHRCPLNGRAFYYNGLALRDIGQTDLGYKSVLHGIDLLTAAQKTRKDAPDEVLLAHIYDQMNKDGDAEKHFKIALSINPNYAPAWSAWSQWLIVHRRVAEGFEAAQKALKISPWNTEARHTILQYYSDNSDWASLRDAARALLKNDPTDPDAKSAAAVAQAGFDAVKVAEAKARKEPSVNEYLALSVRYYQTRQFADSVKACQQALKINPNQAEAYSNMAAAYYALGRVDDSIQALRETIKIMPDLALARHNLDFLMSLKAEKATAPSKPTP